MLKRLFNLSVQGRALLRSREGAVAPLIAFVMLVLIGCVGLGIDIGRAAVVKARLVSALDAAGLAVGARTATSDFTADARKYVDANFKLNYAGATVTSVTASATSDKSVITLTATATMPTALMKLFGTNSVTVTHTTEVTRKSAGLEVVLVLDNTGSMASNMPTLKNAANSLMNTLFGSATVGENLYVGLVPFSETVNIGADRTSWMKGSKPRNWSGCVMARYLNGLDQTDDPPTDPATKFEYYESSSACPEQVTPLTNQKATITAGIKAMTPVGNTHINLGAVWGWRVISPKWRGTWSSATIPLDYNTPNMSKAAIIMTDGDNNMSGYTAYGYLSDERLGTRSARTAAESLDNRLATVCTNMKTNGITVYTVAFGSMDASTKLMLQTCATSAAFYFPASNNSALLAAFQSIGDSLSNLRVSK